MVAELAAAMGDEGDTLVEGDLGRPMRSVARIGRVTTPIFMWIPSATLVGLEPLLSHDSFHETRCFESLNLTSQRRSAR